ncbi:hypothetical protein HNR60_001247 [Rhodopseudomonas rhenobacensis]|uniref:DUF7662 domain-containing protein n=1 Tax=Rhodopseudomonas rhenobacensis TaxID=87461 RepID=A0A7W8DY67_9BRAD|nr:hypothetical protein [Rhodopseudomonas rhenobacensis]MBB5046502.1 hypothetical protein [Rhodopseudomonas rhenobacensis]
MGKYEPLTEFLRKQATLEVRMSFAQVERVLGFKLPPVAQRHRAWWSNSPTNNVMTKAWLDAGFRSEQVDMAAGKLVFRRQEAGNRAAVPSGRHPLFGWMKGTVTFAPGVDLTEPADPEWADRIERELPTSA